MASRVLLASSSKKVSAAFGPSSSSASRSFRRSSSVVRAAASSRRQWRWSSSSSFSNNSSSWRSLASSSSPSSSDLVSEERWRHRPSPPSNHRPEGEPVAIRWDDASSLAQEKRGEDYLTLGRWLDAVWRVNVPKGFENFYPRKDSGGGGGGKKPDDNDKKGAEKKAASEGDGERKEEGGESSGEKKSNPLSDFGKRKNNDSSGGGGGGFGSNSGGGGGSGNNNDAQQAGAALFLLLSLLAARSLLLDEENGGGPDGREVTWADFRNYMLEEGDVERIVVINKKTARVYLRPGARGVPRVRERGGVGVGIGAGAGSGSFGMVNGGGGAAGAVGSSGQRRARSDAAGGRNATKAAEEKEESDDGAAGWDDGTEMDMGPSSDAENESSSSTLSDLASNLPGMSPQGNGRQRQLVYHFNIGSVESFEDKLTRAQREMNIDPRDYVPVRYASETNWLLEIIKSSPALIMIGITAYMLRGMGMGGMMGGKGGGGGGGMGGIFQVGKSNAKKINKEDVSVSFKDVAGCQEAKKEIMEFVDFLQDSTRFTKLGAKIPKGALLCGPPGTGKTLLAKAVAGEASVPFFSISGSDFIEMFVGVGPSRVRDLFKEARNNAPCIVFIDEIDAVGRKRGRGGFSGGNDERENTLNQLLVEMDGFTPSSGVVVLAGTNRADILDEALTRPGRFDRQITVDKPDLAGRKEIFLVHLQGITLEGTPEDVAGRLAGLTPGFAGADIANICNEAAIVAARRKADAVSLDDFEKATDRIVGGLESNKIMSDEERSIVAHHEAGHAVAGWFLEHADPLLKVTIIPRSSGALGYAQYLPKEVFLRTQSQIMDIVCMALAGRAAEEVFFDRVTTGASDDLRRVTELVYSTIQVYGMNSRVGQLAFPKDPNAAPGDKPYSDATAEAMDEEARRVVDEAYARTVELIREKRSEVESVAAMLLEKETITHDDIYDTIGPRPFEGDAAYQEYVSKRQGDKVKEEETEEEAVREEESKAEEEEDKGMGSGGLTPGLACMDVPR